MSFNNTHMCRENMINLGIRHDIVKLSTNKRVLRPEEEIYLHLTAQLADIHTWEQLKTVCVTPSLYGNTKCTDFWILAGYFHEGLHMVQASKEVGYAISINKHGKEVTNGGIEFRLRRINAYHLFSIIKVLLDKNIIRIETLQDAFEINKTLPQGEHAKRRGNFYKYYAKWFINDGLTWFTSNGSTTPVQDLSNYLGISKEAINFWSTIPVKEVRIIH